MEELSGFRKIIDTYFGLIFKIALVLVILSTFFLFTSLTTEMFDTPKFIILLVFTAFILVLLMLKFTLTNKVVFVRTPLDIPLILLLAVGIVSTFLSSSPFVTLLGNQLKINGSLISIVVYILFYFVLVNNLKGVREIKWIFGLAVIAAQFLSIISLLAYSGLKLLPPPWTQGLNFTTTGSSFSTAAILVLLIPFVVNQILQSHKPIIKIMNASFLLIMGITIALTGSWTTWAAGALALALTIGISNLGNLRRLNPFSLANLAVPLVLTVLIALLSFIPPMAEVENPLYTKAQNFPREIQLDLVTSWKISVSAFRDLPFWGSGPATYLFDFTNYKPVEFNATKFWNLRFDTSFNEYLQTLATLGAVGLIALLSLTALFISSAYGVLSTVYRLPSTAEVGSQKSEVELKTALAISGLIFFVILALHSSTLPVWIMGILILASYMVVNLDSLQKSWGNAAGSLKNTFLKIAANMTSRSSSEEIKIDALPGILLAVAIALVAAGGYFGGKLILADYHHRLALNAVAQNQGVNAYNELVAAEKLNPWSDLYRTDLAQTNFALANAIAAAKGPTEASPSGSLTDQDKQNIQVLLQQSINEARTAVTLSPKSAQNWEVLALLYRQIAGVAQNALVFSLDSYGRAIFQDPLNPSLRLNVGGVYYAVRNYDMAIRFFTDAANLKPDFANAYYNLSVALRDKGDLTNAQAMAEKVLTLVDQSSPDYQVASDYLDSLKKQTAPTAESVPQQPPAAQTQGALQNQALPKVVDVGKAPQNIATPAAVKKPAVSPTPAPTTTP